MPGYYRISSAGPKQYRFSLHTPNGDRLLTSEVYVKESAAQSGIEECQENCTLAYRYLHLVSVKGEPYFVLTTANGKILGTSEMYSNEVMREMGVEAVMRSGPSFVVKQ